MRQADGRRDLIHERLLAVSIHSQRGYDKKLSARMQTLFAFFRPFSATFPAVEFYPVHSVRPLPGKTEGVSLARQKPLTGKTAFRIFAPVKNKRTGFRGICATDAEAGSVVREIKHGLRRRRGRNAL